MKKMKINNLFGALILTSILIFSGCANLEKMKEEASSVQWRVEPSVLEMHGGQLEATITGEFPSEYFNKEAIVTVTPIIQYEGGQVELEEYVLQGEEVQANNKVIGFDAGGSFTHNISAEYSEDMRVSELAVSMQASMGDDQLDLGNTKIADGVIATPGLVQVDPKPIIMPDKFSRIKNIEEMANIHYVINRSYVRRSELAQEDIQAFEEFIENITGKEQYKVNKAGVYAYASPDGPIDFNEKLSEDRKESGQSVLQRRVRDLGVTEENNFYDLKSTTEDWEGFKNLVQNSDIEDKELILRVLSMYEDPEVKEQELRKMSEAFVVLAEDILPKLRRSELKIDVDEIGFSDEEIADYIDSKPDTLDLEEMLYAATLTDDDNEKLEIYQATLERHPECPRAQNNVGVMHIKLGDLDAAEDALNAAKEMKDNNPVVNNNLGVIELERGNVEAAQELFTQSTDAGQNVNHNLGIIAIKNGNYDAAINYLSQSESFNAALAMVLVDKNSSAMNLLDQLEEQDAMMYYLKAVTAARMDNSNVAFDNLRMAVNREESLKEMAATDMEFASYFENETFQSIVQ